MSAYQPDAEAGRPNGEGPPAFQVVRRGYDREEVDAYFSQLAARLKEAVDQYATTERARAELQDEVTSLQKRAPSFEQVGGEAAALLQEPIRMFVRAEPPCPAAPFGDPVNSYTDGPTLAERLHRFATGP